MCVCVCVCVCVCAYMHVQHKKQSESRQSCYSEIVSCENYTHTHTHSLMYCGSCVYIKCYIKKAQRLANDATQRGRVEIAGFDENNYSD